MKDALGLGERIQLNNGTYIECVPACLADLDDAMEHWANSLGKGLNVQGCYHPRNRNDGTKDAFEELLYIACGRKIPKDELRAQINVANGAEEVVSFIDRFLGFELRAAGVADTAK